MLLAMVLFVVGAAIATTDAARQLVVEVSNQVIQALHDHPDLEQRDPDYVYDLLNRTVAPHFDFDTMARLVLGRYWNESNPQQQQRFVTAFRTYLVRIYAVSLAQYKDQKIDYKPLHAPAGADKLVVQTEVRQANGPAILIDYRMHLTAGQWKVYDVTIDGVSLVANNRRTFAAEIHDGGIDALAAHLAQRNRRTGS